MVKSINSTQQDCLMILLGLIRDSKKITSLFLRDTMKKSFMTWDFYCKKIYFSLTDSHKNEQRTENNFTLTYYIICVTHEVLICQILLNNHLITYYVISTILARVIRKVHSK